MFKKYGYFGIFLTKDMNRKIFYCLTPLLFMVSGLLYYYHSKIWYNFLVFGAWFLFDNLASLRKQKTTLDIIIKKKYKLFLEVYLVLLGFGILIELLGSILLGLWSYPKLWSIEPFWFMLLINIVGYLCYPFILISFIEEYRFFKTIVKRWWAVILSVVVGILIWEIPNVFSRDWIYNIPYFKSELFGVNLIVILGWLILVIFPVLLDHFVLRHKISEVKF